MEIQTRTAKHHPAKTIIKTNHRGLSSLTKRLRAIGQGNMSLIKSKYQTPILVKECSHPESPNR